VIDDLSINLFRDSLVKAAVTRLHMKHRDLPALCRISRETTIGVTQDQKSVWFHRFQQGIGSGDDVTDRFHCGFCRCIEN